MFLSNFDTWQGQITIVWATWHLQTMIFMGTSAKILALEVRNGPCSIQLDIALCNSIGERLEWRKAMSIIDLYYNS